MLKLKNFIDKREKIFVIGLGYVGLPLVVLFNTKPFIKWRFVRNKISGNAP